VYDAGVRTKTKTKSNVPVMNVEDESSGDVGVYEPIGDPSEISL